MISNQPPPENDQRATQRLDPDSVDQTFPDANPDQPDVCQVVEVTTRDGRPLTFAVHTLAPLTPGEQAALGEIARAAAERALLDDPHAGVITELMLASMHARRLLRVRSEQDVATRLGLAVKTAADVIRSARAERVSRFRWAEEAAEADLRAVSEQARANVLAWLHAEAVWQRDRARAELKNRREVDPGHTLPARAAALEGTVDLLTSELAELRERAVPLPDDWRDRVMDAIGECDGEVAIELIQSWRADVPTDAPVSLERAADATCSVEWGVRWSDRKGVDVRDTEADAREHLGAFDGLDDVCGELVHRTVTHTEWLPASDQRGGGS